VLSVYEHADLSTVEPLCKIEAAVLDLARAGFTVQRLLDVIPEPDPQILRALESLCNEGIVVLDA
jgi:hypothetical protein